MALIHAKNPDIQIARLLQACEGNREGFAEFSANAFEVSRIAGTIVEFCRQPCRSPHKLAKLPAKKSTETAGIRDVCFIPEPPCFLFFGQQPFYVLCFLYVFCL